MRLRRVMEHMKSQNWFAVALDFVIVVIGVGVAMYGQQWLSDRQQRADLAKAEIAIQRDLVKNYAHAKERLALADCRTQTYQAIAAQLLAPVNNWAGQAKSFPDKAYWNVLPIVFRSPQRTWGSRAWDAELERGTFNQMSDELRTELTSLFVETDDIVSLQNDVYALQSRLQLLAVDTTISQSDRLRYYDILTELDSKSGQIENMSVQLIEAIERIGIEPSAEDWQAISELIYGTFKRQKNVYGECVKEQEHPALEAYLKKS